MFVCFIYLQGTVSCRGRLWLAVRQLLFSSPLMAPRSTTSTNGCVNMSIFHNRTWWACPLEEIRFQWQCQCHVFILVLSRRHWCYNYYGLILENYTLFESEAIHEAFICQLIYLKCAACFTEWTFRTLLKKWTHWDLLMTQHDVSKHCFFLLFFSSITARVWNPVECKLFLWWMGLLLKRILYQ